MSDVPVNPVTGAAAFLDEIARVSKKFKINLQNPSQQETPRFTMTKIRDPKTAGFTLPQTFDALPVVDQEPVLLQIMEGPPDEGKIPWPKHGKDYHVVFEVEYIGKHWEDQPHIDMVYCHADLDYILSENNIGELVDSDELPIASGTYSATFTFHHYPHTDWETGAREDDYGFTVSGLKHVSPFTQDYYER